MQFYHYLAAIILGTTIGASTGIIMSEQKSKADVNELAAFLTGALPQAIRNCLAVTDDMKDCNYVRYPMDGRDRWEGGGVHSDTKVELLRYGDIPDYYPQKPLKETERALNKKQKISVLNDYEVVGLVPPEAHPYYGDTHNKKYKRKIYTPNRRRALVVLKLSDEAMRNCQAIIDKIKEHPNVGYISLTSATEEHSGYPCRGTYSKVRGALEGHEAIVSKAGANKGRVTIFSLVTKKFSTTYPDLSLTNGNYVISTGKTEFHYGYKKENPEEPVFGFHLPNWRGYKNHIFITYSF